MKIDIQAIDQENFMVHEHIVNGELLYLVQPQFMGCQWTQNNKIFRSSVWNAQGELVSAGFPKFTNWGENPDNFPVPKSLKDTFVVEKIDGSLLIVSKYKGNYILRTRGTVDATKLDNGPELEIFKDTILRQLEAASTMYWNEGDTWNVSLLFEWTSPFQRIILNYGETPTWYWVGAVKHEDYSLWEQGVVGRLSKKMGIQRPATYSFPSVEDLIKGVEEWKGKEGVCVYSKNGQMIHKVKGAWYLALHRMKEALASIDKVIDVWFEQGCPTYQEFEKFITDRFDWELWSQVRGDASRICDAYKEVEKILDGMNVFVGSKLRPLATRREQAELTISSYGKTNRAAFVFKILDGKELTRDDEKKLLYQVLKK